MPKFSQVPTNASPALTDFLLGVSSGAIDQKTTLAALAAIFSANLTNGDVTTRKMKPSYTYVETDNGTATRQAVTALASVCSMSYTTGPTAETVMVDGGCLSSNTAPGTQVHIGLNGAIASKCHYQDNTGGYYTSRPFAELDLAANTTYTIQILVKPSSGTVTVANATADKTAGYGPSLRVIAFGR